MPVFLFVVGIVLLIAAAVALFFYLRGDGFRTVVGDDGEPVRRPRRRGRVLAVSIGTFVVGILFIGFANVTSVDAGEVLVPVRFGEVQPVITQEGLNRVSPFATRVRMPIRTVEITFSATEGGIRPITALSAEGATVDADLTVLYHIDPTMADDVYRTVGTTWEEVLVIPIARSVARDVFPDYEFEEARTTQRSEASAAILAGMQAKLATRGIVVEDVLLRNLEADEQLQQAIDDKLQAQNEVKEAEFLRQKAEVDAQTAVIQAEGRANAAIAEAEGTAEANRLIEESLSENILNLRIIEALGDKAVVYFVGQEGGITPVLPLPTPDGG